MASSTLKIPVPAEQRGTTSEGVIAAGHDDHDLHFVRYHPPSSSSASPPALSVVFVHGFVEHIGRYKDAFPLFAARGIELIAYDQRGFGKTADERLGGFQKNYTDTVWPKQFRDVQAVVVDQRQWLDQKYGENKVPIYLVGHSMGGGIVTGIMTRDASSQDAKELEQVRTIAQGVVASSPWLVLTNVSVRLSEAQIRPAFLPLLAFLVAVLSVTSARQHPSPSWPRTYSRCSPT